MSPSAVSGSVLGAEPTGPAPPWRHPGFRGVLALASAGALLLAFFGAPLSGLLAGLEQRLAALFPSGWLEGAAWFVIPPAALLAGLLASLSPCVLPLVPLNLALIGAHEATGRRAAGLSARFVLGAAAALATLGLAADLAGLLLIEQRGPVLIAVGILLLYLGLVAAELAPMPLAGRGPGVGRQLGPFAAGAAFALVTSPCASPLLAGILAASAAQQIPGLSAASMLSFALGYTGLVFAAGVWGGSLVRRLRRRSFQAPRAAAAALLIVAGLSFAWAGIRWF